MSKDSIQFVDNLVAHARHLVRVIPGETLLYVSRLMLRPKRAYRATFSCCISSRISLSFSSTVETSSSICSVEVESISCTFCNGSEMNESPILYLDEMVSLYSSGSEFLARTEFCHLRPPTPIHSISLLDLLCLSSANEYFERTNVCQRGLTAFVFSSSSSNISRWCSLLNRLILSWSSLLTSVVSVPTAASSSLVS